MKKRLLTAVLALALALSMSISAYAMGGTTMFTVVVPTAQYTLTFAANQSIEYGATRVEFAMPTVSDVSGFAVGKNLSVTITHDSFSNNESTTTLPYTLAALYETTYANVHYDAIKNIEDIPLIYAGFFTSGLSSPKSIITTGPTTSNATMTKLYMIIKDSDWGTLEPGTYTTTITYTSEVVVE